MPFSLSPLFKTKPSAPDGLTQPQREAIVDLLHLCMYADNLIGLAESKVVTEVTDSFSWGTKSSFASFEARSIARAREAKESEEILTSLLDSVGDRLNTPNSRKMALKVCQQLIATDGTTEKEATLLTKIKQILA